MAAEFGDFSVAFADDGDDLGSLLVHIADEVDGLFVAEDGVRGVGVPGGEDDEWGVAVDEGVGTVLELAGGIAFGLNVG